ncbi:hypothetical protein M9H77_16423 [Catharanthus roseus]|uniref:Uncharacterized protein n=1 Tax=Catharanthus roseus TaxID=4058 RepID=A0ACC0B1Q4_CATRO|nr:hypothetical protein M9H77_16423 [Catharanthus roseus]
MQGRNTVEEVLCLSAKRGYTVFYRNCEDSNVLSDIVVAHPTSIKMMRTWPYVLIMDTTYKTNKCYEDEVEEQAGLLHYLFNTWLNPFAHKFVRCWTKSVMHFGVETTNWAESEHSVLKLWLSICHGDLDTVSLNIDSLIEGQITDIKASLEFSKTKEKFNAKSNQILRMQADYTVRSHTPYPVVDIEAFWKTLEIDKYRTISKVREMCRLAKGVLSPVLPEDPGVTLTSPPEVAVTKGRKKTNFTKRDKSHWKHVSIDHRKIQNLSGYGSSSGSGSSSASGSGSRRRGRPPRAPRERGRGRARRQTKRVYELVHRTQWQQDGPAPLEHWLETPDSLYIIENAFNLCVVLIPQLGSMTVLPVYSYSDCPGSTLVIGLLTEHQHFIQLQIHDECPIPPKLPGDSATNAKS